MLVNKPEDRSKVIVLSVLIVFCILYFFVMILPRLLHAGSPAPHPNQAADNTPPPAPAVTAGPAPSGGPATGAPVTLAQRPPGSDYDTDASGGPFPGPTPAPSRDPFTPPTPPPSAAPPVIVAPHPTTVAFVKPSKPATLPAIPLPPFGGPETSPKGPGGSALPGVSAVAAPAPLPEIALKGIIQGGPGSTAVAVLRIGQETLHKYPGELLAPDLRLARITDEGVVLKRGKQSIPLEIGQSTNEASSSSGVGSENSITTAASAAPAPAKQPAAKEDGKPTARATGNQATPSDSQAADKPASREVAVSSLPSAHKPASKSQKPLVFHRAHRRRKVHALYIYRHGAFVRYHSGHGWHVLYVRRHGRFVRYHLRHHRHRAAA